MSARICVVISVTDAADWDASHEVSCELALAISKLVRNSQCAYAHIEIDELEVRSDDHTG